MIPRTPEQNTRFYALIAALGIDADQKRDLVYNASKGRITSSAKLDYTEMAELIEHLQSLVNSSPEQQKASKMRKKIMSIFHELNWETKGGQLDYGRINGWMTKSSYLHKFLNDYTVQELPRLVTQVDTMLKKQMV